VPRLQRKSFATPDEVRTFPPGRIDVVRLDEVPVGRFVFQPGWVWSKDVAPITGTRSCQHRHVGYTISGRLRVRMEDGTELVIAAGEAYEIPPGHDAWVDGDEPWTSVEFTSAHSFAVSPEALGERVLATLVFSDIVDSTKMLARLGDRKWADLLQEHNVRVRAAIDRYRGREMATTGDGFLALFDGAARAASAALQMTSATAAIGLRIRVGIHTGEVELVGGQARGVAVHAAARVSALARGGEVLVSGTTHDLLEGSSLSFEPRGVHELKGLTGARPIYALSTQAAGDVSL
jgi:class 3 adenylate cyclase